MRKSEHALPGPGRSGRPARSSIEPDADSRNSARRSHGDSLMARQRPGQLSALLHARLASVAAHVGGRAYRPQRRHASAVRSAVDASNSCVSETAAFINIAVSLHPTGGLVIGDRVAIGPGTLIFTGTRGDRTLPSAGHAPHPVLAGVHRGRLLDRRQRGDQSGRHGGGGLRDRFRRRGHFRLSTGPAVRVDVTRAATNKRWRTGSVTARRC